MIFNNSKFCDSDKSINAFQSWKFKHIPFGNPFVYIYFLIEIALPEYRPDIYNELMPRVLF